MIVLGRLTTPYGINGWLKLRPFGDDPQAWSGIKEWWLSPQTEEAHWTAWKLGELRFHSGGVIIRLEGVNDRTAAESLEGMFVGVPREALPRTGKDEYYWADLIGLAVRNERGESLGKVNSLIETGAHRVLVVKAEGRERLLPFVGEIVKQVSQDGILVAWEQDW